MSEIKTKRERERDGRTETETLTNRGTKKRRRGKGPNEQKNKHRNTGTTEANRGRERNKEKKGGRENQRERIAFPSLAGIDDPLRIKKYRQGSEKGSISLWRSASPCEQKKMPDKAVFTLRELLIIAPAGPWHQSRRWRRT